MTARRVGCYSLAGLIGSLVAAVTSYAAGDPNSLRAACSGDGAEVDVEALGSATTARTTEGAPVLSVVRAHKPKEQQ